MGPCCFQIVGTHFNARPNRREIRNVIFVKRTRWECSQVAGKMQGAFLFFFFLKIQQTLSAKASLMKFLFILIILELAIWNKADRFYRI